MDGIKRQSGQTTRKHPSSANHRTLQKSATLNRKFVKKPGAQAQIIKTSQAQATALARRQALAEEMNRQKLASLQKAKETAKPSSKKIAIKINSDTETTTQAQAADLAPSAPTKAVAKANAAVAARKTQAQPKTLSAHELKERAIKQAMMQVATMSDEETSSSKQIAAVIPKKKKSWQTKKFFAAAAMSLATIAALGYLVHLNLPDLSVKVAAMQSGIESAYPSYMPRGYSLNGLVSEKDGKIVMTFSGNADETFTITEQKSPWDSAALLSQFILPSWGTEYTLTKEQGLTIYTSDSNAAWINGGVFYLIEAPSNTLTKQQLRDIAISL